MGYGRHGSMAVSGAPADVLPWGTRAGARGVRAMAVDHMSTQHSV